MFGIVACLSIPYRTVVAERVHNQLKYANEALALLAFTFSVNYEKELRLFIKAEMDVASILMSLIQESANTS